MVTASFLLNLFSGFALLGLILVVHLVHYPSFRYISKKEFKEFHRFHSFEITKIVLPLMFIELFTSFYFSAAHWSALWTVNIVLVLGLWGVTFFWSVPCHSQLEEGFEEKTFQSLMKSNLIRTWLWVGRAGILIYFTWEKLT